MANPEQSTEPSMEDILASIRKIISDEDEVPEGGAAEAAPASEDDQDRAFEEADGDVFETADQTQAAIPEPEPQEAESDVFEATDDIDSMFDEANGAVEADSGDDDVFDSVSMDEPEADVLSLSEDEIVESGAESEADEFAPIIKEAVEPDLEFTGTEEFSVDELEPEPEPEPEPAAPAEPEPQASAPPAAASPNQGLLSDTTNVAVSSAFSNLANVMLSSDSRTLEDLVKEMLKPMLAGWLDENLPPMVERLVREEIERVSRGGR